MPFLVDRGWGVGCAKRDCMTTKKSADLTDRHVGARVRMRHIMLGMSQGQLGAALGLTFQQVQKYEKGENRIGASRLHRLSDVLMVPMSFFFDGGAAPSDRLTMAKSTPSL